MTTLFNQHKEKRKRQQLRHQIPESEVIMWSRLKNSQLTGFKFRRQTSIGRYVVDFFCPKAHLIIEVDGDSHFTDEAEAYDKVREEYLKSLGLTILRFTNLEVRTQLSDVLERIRNHLLIKTTPPRPKRAGTPPS